MSLIMDNCDDFSTSSIMEFLKKEQECYQLENNITDDASDLDVESIFEEIQRLSGTTSEPNRDIDEILKEAEVLLKKDLINGDLKQLENFNHQKTDKQTILMKTPLKASLKKSEEISKFEEILDAVEPDSVISDESTPIFLNNEIEDNTDETDTDTIEDIAEGIETIHLNFNEQYDSDNNTNCNRNKLLSNYDNNSLNVLNSKLVNNNIKEMKEQKKKYLSNRSKEIFLTSTKIQVSSITTNMLQNDINQSNDENFTPNSPKYISVKTSPIENMPISRENQLKLEIDQLQEKLKDTEERLQSLKIQHDSLSQIHRDMRDSHTNLQGKTELLKLDVQHLNECANVLRIELQTARNDRKEASDIQKHLQSELNEVKIEKKKTIDQNDKDGKLIQDLQRQCKEMEKILLRKHPDSVSALIVASKNPSHSKDDSSTRRLLEQRIAQLEADAKEQDVKAQKILQNVQSKFNSVQSKYEHHIADLETQVLSLQQINTKLNEKIEFQIITLNNFTKSQQQNCTSSSTQTDDFPDREFINLRSNSTQTDSLRPNSSSSTSKVIKKSQQTAKTEAAKEDAHLLATIRGMRIDLAIKDKAVQRLTRELEECKKTIRKLQKEKDCLKHEKPSSSSSVSRKSYDPTQYSDQHSNNDGNNLKEALNKIKLLEFDYKSLHDKRLQDLKTLQAAHERELSSCQETVRILEQKLTERDEAFANQKRRKVPIDYYALKAKVTSLERRHSEREQRLHMLVEALSKGRLNGALEELLNDDN